MSSSIPGAKHLSRYVTSYAAFYPSGVGKRGPACVLVLFVFLFCILCVTNLALWLQDFNKLTSLLTALAGKETAGMVHSIS